MKKRIFTFLLILTTSIVVFSQEVPKAFNYQAVVRNSSGEIIANKTVSFKISLLKDSDSGTVVYSETHSATTNKFGLVNFKIGKGTKLSGDFSPANWGEVIFTKVEIDPAGGSSYSHLVTTKLESVPYAFMAQTVVNDQVDDADADPENEIQQISISGTTLQLSKGGGTVVLPSSGGGSADNWGIQTVVSDATLTGEGTIANPLHAVADGDSNSSNELQTITKTGKIVELSDGGGSFTDEDTHLSESEVDAFVANNGFLTEEIDADPENEIQQISISGTTLQLSKGGGTVVLPSSGGGSADNWGTQTVVSDATLTGEGTTANPLHVVADGDSNSSNELQTITKTGKIVELSDGGGSFTDEVDDADADPGNEIQTISRDGTILTLSKGGGSVTIPTSGGGSGDDWGVQVVQSDATLTGDGTNDHPLSVVADGDGDPENELQTIHLNENILTLSDDGGSVTLPTYWYKNENGINTFDNVGIGTNNPVSKLHVEDGNLRLGDDCRIILGSPNVNSSSTQISFLNKNSYISNFATGSIYFNTKTVPGATVPAYARLKIEPAGNIEIYENLTIDKNITIKGGTPGAGKVLTSDANGLASWQTLASGGNSPWTETSTAIYEVDKRVAIGGSPSVGNRKLEVFSDGGIGIFAENDDDTYSTLYLNNKGLGASAEFRKYIKIIDGTQGAGKVLTSDATGKASWQTPATSGSLWTENGDNICRSSGKVGIGITVPTYSLDINSSSDKSDIRIKSSFSDAHLKLDKASTSDYANIVYASAGTNLFFTGLMGDNNYIIKSSSASQNGIQVSNSGNVTMYNNLNVQGNVGLGTTSPSAPLEIKSNSNPALIIGSATSGSPTRPGIQFKNNTSQWIAGDDGSDEVFGFYAKWASARTHDAKLRVYGNASSSWGKYIQFTHNGTDGFISTDAGDIDITPAGSVGIKTNAPTQTLDVNGNVRVRSIPSGSGSYAVVLGSDGTFKKSSSDIRLKKNIKTLDNSLEKILKLRGVTFTWKANPEYGTRIGFIAQEFEKVIPELSFTNPVDGYKGINYAEVTAVLVEAVKEQQKQIEALKTENNQLKVDNSSFENRLKKLNNLVSGYANK